MRPQHEFEIPFETLFPFLAFYFAQVQDEALGGELAQDVNWPQIAQAVTAQKAVTLTYAQLDSLIFSLKTSIVDHAKPFHWITKHCEANYYPFMKKLKELYPGLFKEEEDGEIILIGNDPAAKDFK